MFCFKTRKFQWKIGFKIEFFFSVTVYLNGNNLLSRGVWPACVATGMTAARSRSDRKCWQCTGKRLLRAIWSSFNKKGMSHLCDSTVAGQQTRMAPFHSPFRPARLLLRARGPASRCFSNDVLQTGFSDQCTSRVVSP